MKSRCTTGIQNQINLTIPSIEYVTVTLKLPGLNTIMCDVPLRFSKPYKFIGVSALKTGNADTNVYLHFYPLNYNPVTAIIKIVPTGGEPWLPLSHSDNSTGKVSGRFIHFKKPVQFLFFDSDAPNGGVFANGFPITFFGTNDIESALLERT